MKETEMLIGGKSKWFNFKIKKLCFMFLVISFLGTILFLVRETDSEVVGDVLPESIKIVRSDGIFVYVITPTYARPVQKAELTRLSHTFRLVPNLHWILVEDAGEASTLVADLLKNSGLPYTHLVQATPPSWKLVNNEGRWKKPRGVLQRNAALKWIRKNFSKEDSGVIYFADDDNTYSLELFEEMRNTKKVSIWPVGLVGGLLVEKPIVEGGKVVGFNAAWRPERKFPIDMAGFAVSLSHFLSKPEAKFSLNSEGGFQETDFLSLLTTRDELEPVAANCTKPRRKPSSKAPNISDHQIPLPGCLLVLQTYPSAELFEIMCFQVGRNGFSIFPRKMSVLVWHTRSEKPSLGYEDQLRRKGLKPSNYGML